MGSISFHSMLLYPVPNNGETRKSSFMLLRVLLIACLLAFPLFTIQAQDSTPTPITWNDAPDTPATRHLGDWMAAAGWYSPEKIYGPFEERGFEVGDETEFRPLLYAVSGATPSFVLKYKSPNFYFWFPPEVQVDEEALIKSAHYLETTAIPQIHAFFGDIDPLGIDGDHRVHIVHEEFIYYGAVGVFRPDDQCPVFLCESSNQRDILYYSLDWADINTDQYFTTIAHEYQHLIRYFQDGNERRWFNEGLSQLGEHLSGYSPEYSVGNNLNIFLDNPDHRLDSWADYITDPSVYYGSSFLFLLYLYERLGLEFVQKAAESPYDGLAAVYRTLAITHPHISLDEIFTDWLIANYLDDPFVADGRYYYGTLAVPLRIYAEQLRPQLDSPIQISRDVNQYGANYFELPAGEYKLLFDGAETTALAPTLPVSGDWMWWSYDAEGSSTRLIRAIDLRDITNASLEFDLWTDLENDFDWFDVMISFDEGERWKPLSTPEMRRPNPRIPVPYISGQTGGWLHQQIDLTPYTGQEILIRFQTTTDNATSFTGALLDNITIPELDWLDDVETLDTGWESQGFLRVTNTVPQNWSLTFIQKGPSPDVTTINLIDGMNNQTLTVEEGGGVLVVGAMAPLTALKASYKLVIETLP